MWFVRLAVLPLRWWAPALDRRIRQRLMRIWSTGLGWIIGQKIVVKGNPPKPPYYLVANHVSYMDVFVLCRVLGCVFVAREDIARWPVFGIMVRSAQIIFIDREQKRDTVRVNKLIEQAIREGDGVAVFAESRISCGWRVEPFKSAVMQPAIALGLPIHYVTLSYRLPPGYAPENEIIGWWRPVPFFVHAWRLLRVPYFTVTVHFGEEPLYDTDRKRLAKELYQAVAKNYVPWR